LWLRHFRAEESAPPMPLSDPYAKSLALSCGGEWPNSSAGPEPCWAWVAPPIWFDQMLQKEIAEGADLIVNCAAGLDARPYRMQLPSTLQWIEA